MDPPIAATPARQQAGEEHAPASPPPAQGPRREAKFVLSDLRAAQFEQWARDRLPLDPHAGPDGAYPVTSLYFDNPAFDSYRRGGAAAWPKHRLRGYDDEHGALFLEEKVRRGDAVWKRRVPCTPADWSAGLPLATSPALAWFRGRFRRLGLRPVLHVRYRRLAFALPDGERVTIDSRIECCPAGSPLELVADPASDRRPALDGQIVELKYSGEPSPVMALALRELHDAPVRNSKYSLSVRRLGLSPGEVDGS